MRNPNDLSDSETPEKQIEAQEVQRSELSVAFLQDQLQQPLLSTPITRLVKRFLNSIEWSEDALEEKNISPHALDEQLQLHSRLFSRLIRAITFDSHVQKILLWFLLDRADMYPPMSG